MEITARGSTRMLLAGAVVVIIAGVVIALALQSRRGDHGGASNGRKIIIVTPAAENEFNSELASGAEAEAKLLGWTVVHVAPTGDSDDAELEAIAATAIKSRPDAISVCGMGTDSLERVVNRANQAGVPIFVHNQIDAVRGDVEAYIGYDEFEAGHKCGEEAVRLLTRGGSGHEPAGKVAIIDGSPGGHTNQRANGFKEALKFHANVQILEEKSADWSKEKADSLTARWLARYPDLSLVFACSDSMAAGAAHAVADTALTGPPRKVFCLGFGGTKDGLFNVKAGVFASTVALEPRKMGARIMHVMMDYFGGDGIVHPGETIRTDTPLITPDMVDGYLGGFYDPASEAKPDDKK